MISPFNEQLRRIVLSGAICEDSASRFLEHVTALECLDSARPITVYIDTFGGSVDSALLIYDTIRLCSCPIITIGIGKVMSAGVLILAAGEFGSRFITENTRVMMHELSAGMGGPLSDMEESIVEMKKLQDMYMTLLANDTGNKKDKILADVFKKDYYLSAEEAVKYGIADKLVKTRKNKKVAPKKAKKKTTKKVVSKKEK